MGSGAYLAAKSEREIFEADYAREREAVEYNEAEAHEVLSLSYQIKGLPGADRRLNSLSIWRKIAKSLLRHSLGSD